MFEVAFSRRMCCSRVCSASRYAGAPSASTETPTRRPGRERFEAGADRHEAGVRAAVEQRHAEALGRADHDVRPGLSRCLQQREREEVGRDGDQRLPLVGGRDQRLQIPYDAAGARVLHQEAEEVTLGQAVGGVGDDDLEAEGLGPGLDDGDRLREAVGVDQEAVALALAVGPVRQRHRLGGGGAFVQQRRVRGRQAGQIGHHGLEVQQGLEPALRDLRLVRRVGRVPGGVLHQPADDHRRGEGAVVPLADHRGGDVVARGELPQLGQRVHLGGGCRQPERLGRADRRGHGGIHQRVDVGVPEGLDHPRDLVLARTDVPVGERGRDLRGFMHSHLRGSVADYCRWPPPLSRTHAPELPVAPGPWA